MTKAGECFSCTKTSQWLSVPCEGCKSSPCITVSFISSIKMFFFSPLDIPTHKTCMQIRVGWIPRRILFFPPLLMASFLSSCQVLWDGRLLFSYKACLIMTLHCQTSCTDFKKGILYGWCVAGEHGNGWLWRCRYRCADQNSVIFFFGSVLWEPMGDGKRVISLAESHIVLWDLQESSTKATVR